MDDKQQNERLGQLLKEAAAARAPEGFAQGVMDRIQALETTKTAASPLIPPWAWALIGGAVAALAGWGWMAGGNGEGYLPESVFTGWMEPVSLPAWEAPAFSPSLVYGVGALAIFLLVHVVWMRRRLEQHWAL